jgi:hypothetical protein
MIGTDCIGYCIGCCKSIYTIRARPRLHIWHSYLHDTILSIVKFACIGSVSVIAQSSSAVDRVFEPRMIQTNDYNIGIYYFSATDTVCSSKSKDGLAKNPDNLSKWSDMSTCKQLSSELALYKSNQECCSCTKRK